MHIVVCLVTSVCLCVCVCLHLSVAVLFCPVHALNFADLDLELSFLIIYNHHKYGSS